MYVKDNKAYATLTDVKNKTGDVFALADEYGEVTITSYNKSKYAIARLAIANIETEPSDLVAEPEVTSTLPAAAEPELIVEAVESVPEPVPELPAAEPIPEIEPVAETQPEPELPPIEIVTSNGQTERVVSNNSDIIGIFAGVGVDSLWDRDNKQERAWTDNTHKLL